MKVLNNNNFIKKYKILYKNKNYIFNITIIILEVFL
jgi:hypothetical protein